MSDHDIAVSVRGLSKSYTLAHNAPKHTTLGEALVHTLKNPRRKLETETFWALRDVEFDIRKGDVVGVIGRNGAGKSTLLKLLSRITEPTSGRIDLYGRVGSLLEVGTGFHPELTGRENVYMNGAILGMSRREIAAHFDAIVAFAEVEQFLDTPVKRYSSGMYVRLAFAVAAHLNPEILIVDEVLAVGDAAFQKKCLGKMQDVSRQDGRTVLFVSHNMAAVRQLCSRGIVLEGGRIRYVGNVPDSITAYAEQGTQQGTILSLLAKPHPELQIEEITVNGSNSSQIEISDSVSALRIEFSGRLLKPLRVEIEAIVTDSYDVRLGFFSPGHRRGYIQTLPAGPFHLVRELLLPQGINKGEYFLHLFLTEPDVRYYFDIPRAVRLVTEGATTETGRVVNYHGSGWLLLSEVAQEHEQPSELKPLEEEAPYSANSSAAPSDKDYSATTVS